MKETLNKKGLVYTIKKLKALIGAKADSVDLDTTNGAVEILQSDFQDLSQGVIAMSSDVSQNKTDISGIKTDITISTATINKYKTLGMK